jgi:tripartite-type tricarboxylate transporter receptor subunit TctC
MKAVVPKTVRVQHRPAPRSNERRLVTQHPRRLVLSLAAGAAALPAVSRISWAQAYPARPITMIVPFAAGGGTDVSGRIVAERMGRALGQSIIVENVPGADGSIGVGRVARARPDGYTIEIGTQAINVLNGAFYSLPYDLLGDLSPIVPRGGCSVGSLCEGFPTG